MVGCYWAEGENGEILMEDKKDNLIHLPESLPGVATGHPVSKSVSRNQVLI